MDNESPLYNSRITNTYLEYVGEHYPEIDIDRILQSARIERYEIEDPAHWLTQSQVNGFHRALVLATGNGEIARDAGRFTALTKRIGTIKKVTLGLISPSSVYLKAGRLYGAMSRGASIETRKLAANRIEVCATPNPGVQEESFQCENRKGTLESLALLFTKDYATVKHPDCFHRGDKTCRYVITWAQTDSMRWKRISRFTGLGTLGLACITPFILPFTASAIAVLTAVIVSAGCFISSLAKEKNELIQTIENQGNVAREMLDAANSRYNDTALMHEVGSATVSIEDVESYVGAVTALMEKRLSFDRGLIMLQNNQKGKLQYIASYGHTAEQLDVLKGAEFHLDNPDSRGLFVKAFKMQRPYIVDDVEKIISSLSANSKAFARTIAAKSFICVPIVYQGEPFGILAVDNYHTGTPLTQSNLSIVTSIGTQIATGIANANVITQLREGEEKYRELYQEAKKAEAVYRSLIRSSADAILLYDLDYNPQYASPEFQSTFQWTLEELHDKGLSIVPDTARESVAAALRQVAENGDPIRGFETKIFSKDNELHHVSVSASRYDDHANKPAGVLSVIRDISENKRLENQLQHAQKMEAIGTLAGGIAHDFNNLLSVIQGNLSLMKMEIGPDHAATKRLDNIDKQLKSGSRLTSQLLGYARKGNYQVQALNMTRHLKETVEAFGRARKEIIVHFDPPPTDYMVEADPGQMEQVLFNLYVNAADAMPEGGDLFLKIGLVDHTKIKARHYSPAPGNYVMVEVADTGLGMSADVRQRAFEPFFTTKTMGKGTGLGLASVYGIIKTHQGYVEIESQPGQGTAIQIFLPVSAKQHTAAEQKTNDKLAKGRECILFVDDEPMLLEVGTEMLQMVGYRVLAAGSGQKAIEIFENNRDDIDLVLFDMIMPGMNGGELFDKIAKIKPDVKTVLSSGYSIDGQAQQIMERGCNGFIQKPFDVKKLSRKIRDVLEDKEEND
ncbi:MAG: response regulator [Deltaproteobacteria bacterium]|nr:response regulator [Deltaproteobacteria bacterium]